MVPTNTEHAEAHTFAEQSARASAAALRARFALFAVIVPVLLVLQQWGGPGWNADLTPVAAFGLFSAVLIALRRSAIVLRVAPFLFVLDVLLVFEVQRRSLSTSPFPAGVAGFSLGLFALLVSLTGSTMRLPAIVLVTVAAIPAQVALMQVAGVGAGAQVLAAFVLLAVLSTQAGINARLRRMVRSLASSEIAWRREHDQVTELTQARATIERMLVEARAQNAELVTLQAEKDSLTSLLVHDLRAPLGAVRANLDWIRSELPVGSDPEIINAVSESRQVTDRLSGMIGDLLNISQLERGALQLARESKPCSEMLGALHRQLQAQARSRRITVEFQCDDVVLEADHALLMRALENIASNALRYTPAGGRLRLEAHRDGASVVYSVRNDGPVIPQAKRAGLFDKYVQAGSEGDNRRAGWGLGLYFCRLCMDAHGGTIGVVDRAGWSTSFDLRVPGAAAPRLAA
ncbi:MAG: ATP-binding protein [Archangium sp.]|nr:ATP-binding protein [Archangium sp.]